MTPEPASRRERPGSRDLVWVAWTAALTLVLWPLWSAVERGEGRVTAPWQNMASGPPPSSSPLIPRTMTSCATDPAGALAKLLPLWSTREIGTYAIDPVDAGYLERGLAHFAVTFALLTTLAVAAGLARLHLVRLPVPQPAHPTPQGFREETGH